MIILGLNLGHDASSCIIVNGEIIADVAEERFSRLKHDCSFPYESIKYCLKVANVLSSDIDEIAIGASLPSRELKRWFSLSDKQKAYLNSSTSVKERFKERLIEKIKKSKDVLPLYISKLELSEECTFKFIDHHLAHAASAYFTRGRYDPCLVVTMDGVGDGTSVAVWLGEGSKLTLLEKWGTNASLGWFYGNVTEALGWCHGDGEGTTMGLSPYGKPELVGSKLGKFYPKFKGGTLSEPHDFVSAGSCLIRASRHYHLHETPEIQDVVTDVGKEHVAARAQQIIEEECLPFIRYWLDKLETKNLVCSGGLFLNIKLNQRIWCELELDDHWIYPNPGDSGLAVGAALYVYFHNSDHKLPERMEHLYLGPEYSNDEIKVILDDRDIKYEYLDDPTDLAAQDLSENKVIAWFQGRMESGPRALGNRSILMSANAAKNKEKINAKVKFRQAFRPFCPSMLYEEKEAYLLNPREEKFMMTSFEVTEDKKCKVPAVVHEDGTLRPQTLKHATNPLYHTLIKKFGDITGEYLLLNTSFNIKGEPVICSPREAIRCFFDSGLDVLYLGNFRINK